jgi:conjugative transposon TraM protein
MRTQNLKANNKRLLLVLPLLAFPFVTLAFWALGGGKGNAGANIGIEKGLNLQLPDAHNGSGPSDKMSYYDQATADSLKKKQLSQNDPYYHQQQQDVQQRDTVIQPNQNMPANQVPGMRVNSNNSFAYHDPNEAKVYQKLGQLNRLMAQPQQYPAYGNQPMTSPQQASVNAADVDRLERMMQSMQGGGDTGTDPETAQLNGMLERILDIQHPERVKEKIKASEDKRQGHVYAVVPAEKQGRISMLDNSKATSPVTNGSNGFYGLSDTATIDDQNAIDAVIHEDQILVSGSTVKFRLLDDINVRGTIIPKGNFIYGTVALEGERLQVKIKSVRYKKSLFPVQLSVFDIDGIDGIYIPGAIARDVAKSSADRSIQTLGVSSFDQGLGAQAAGAGIEAAKSFLSKKVKLIKVMVKAGYKVLLRDDKQKDE